MFVTFFLFPFQLLSSNSDLESTLLVSSELSATLTVELEKSTSEMESVQSRLGTALEDLDSFRARQARDEETIRDISGRCKKMEDR
jgi:hypothetical protein